MQNNKKKEILPGLPGYNGMITGIDIVQTYLPRNVEVTTNTIIFDNTSITQSVVLVEVIDGK